MKDHEIAALVNNLRDVAISFHGTQQLRSRIQDLVLPAIKSAAAPNSQLVEALRKLILAADNIEPGDGGLSGYGALVDAAIAAEDALSAASPPKEGA